MSDRWLWCHHIVDGHDDGDHGGGGDDDDDDDDCDDGSCHNLENVEHLTLSFPNLRHLLHNQNPHATE